MEWGPTTTTSTFCCSRVFDWLWCNNSKQPTKRAVSDECVAVVAGWCNLGPWQHAELRRADEPRCSCASPHPSVRQYLRSTDNLAVLMARESTACKMKESQCCVYIIILGVAEVGMENKVEERLATTRRMDEASEPTAPCGGVDGAGGADDDVPFPEGFFDSVQRPTKISVRLTVDEEKAPLQRSLQSSPTDHFSVPAVCAQCRIDVVTGKLFTEQQGPTDELRALTPPHSDPETKLPVISFRSVDDGEARRPLGSSTLGTLTITLCSQSASADGSLDGGDLTGFSIFPETRALSQYLVDHRSWIRGRRLLELGAGLALPSRVALACGASLPVHVTDGCASVIDLCANHPGLRTWRLLWQLDEDCTPESAALPPNVDSIDVVVGSGVAYATAALGPLFHTVRRLLTPRSANSLHEQD